MMRHWFGDGPCFFPENIVVATGAAAEQPRPGMGQLLPLSPEELLAAFVLQNAEDIGNATDSWKRWEQILLSVPVEFKRFEGLEDMYMYAVQLRENVDVQKENLHRTAFGRIYELYAFKCTKEVADGKSVTNETIVSAYVKVKASVNTEKVTVFFVPTALMLNPKLKVFTNRKS